MSAPAQLQQAVPRSGQAAEQAISRSAAVIPLRSPSRLHDPLRLIQEGPPGTPARVVLWSASLLILALLVWSAFGKLDIIATAEGKLTPRTLVKIVQPAESGVLKELFVEEGDNVGAGQVLARLDTTLASADKAGIADELATQEMQVRRLEAELSGQPMTTRIADEPRLYAQVQSQYLAHRRAYLDALVQEQALLSRAEHEKRSASEILAKIEQSLPTYKRSADAYAKLEREGFIGGIAAAEKQRDLIEKGKDLDAQAATVAAANSTIVAQQQRISQLQSAYRSELEKELAEARARARQLLPQLGKTVYREGLMELRSPQDGTIKDLATTTLGAVVQPGMVILTLVPKGEPLFADVSIKNEDVGFVRTGQKVRIKLSAYPFQRHGTLSGRVVRVSADATEAGGATGDGAPSRGSSSAALAAAAAPYKARVQLDSQVLEDAHGSSLLLTPGMQVLAEIHQGTRSVLEYLLSPVRKTISEAARER